MISTLKVEKSEAHKDVFPSIIVPLKVEPMLPEIVLDHTIRLHVHKIGIVCAGFSSDANPKS